MNINVKNWYTSNFPLDEMGLELNSDLTFRHLLTTLRSGEDFYEAIGVGDSLIRERLFSKLSSIMDVDYKFIYDLWLNI